MLKKTDLRTSHIEKYANMLPRESTVEYALKDWYKELNRLNTLRLCVAAS